MVTSGISWLPSSIFTAPFYTLFPRKLPEDTTPIVQDARKRASRRAQRRLFRSSIVLLACYILLVEPASMAVLGNAAFFSLIVAMMLPPMMPVVLFIFMALTIVLGQCIGWAWCCAAMAAALAARDQVLLASQFQRVQASLAGATNPESLYSVAIFKGQFLDARSTIVTGVFFFVGTFVLGLMRAKQPKLALFAILGSIVMDVMLSYGPLFPFAQYTLATSFMIPTACYLAIAMAGNWFIFPETLNTSWTSDLTDNFLIPLLERSQLHSKVLATPNASTDPAPWVKHDAAFAASSAKLAAGFEALLGMAGMMELEISRGRFSAKDLKSLLQPMRDLMSRAMALSVLCHLVHRRHVEERTSLKTDSNGSDDKTVHGSVEQPGTTHRLRQFRSKVKSAESAHSHDASTLLPILHSSSAELRLACDNTLIATVEWLSSTNSRRWQRGKAKSTDTVEWRRRIAELEAALVAFKSEGRQAIIEPFAHFFNDDGSLKAVSGEYNHLPFSPSSLFLCFSAQFDLIGFAETLLKFAKAVNDLAEKRDHNRMWFPSSLRKFGNALKGGKTDPMLGDGNNPHTVEPLPDTHDDDETLNGDNEKPKTEGEKAEKELEEEVGRLDPDAKPPRNGGQRLTLKIYGIGQWLKEADTLFAIRFAAVSILLWLPQIFPSSAYFTYREKGLWALIMAQTGLAVYVGDQISQTVQKLVGTLVGLVYGMLIWYIGAGSGIGNAIGLGASLYILVLVPLAVRMFGPPQYQQACIMGSITVMLIVGYSWLNTHTVTLGVAAKGVELAWRRALLVIIGMVAGTIIMIFPSPSSSRLLVRQTHATCIEEVGRIYSIIVGAWLSEERSSTSAPAFTQDGQAKLRARILALALKLRSIKVAIGQAGFEVSLRGDWPAKEYTALLDCQMAVIEALSQFGRALTLLDPEWRRVLVKQTAFLNPNLIADVTSTFYLVSLALRQGSPLPETTPGPLLDRLLYHESARLATANRPAATMELEAEEHEYHHIEGARLGRELTWDLLKDERFVTHATALLALTSVLNNLDKMELVAKSLVGEVKFPGYQGLGAWRGGKVDV